MSEILSIITEISKEPKRNDKIKIIQENKDNDLLRDVFLMTYDNRSSFYIDEIPEYSRVALMSEPPLSLQCALKRIEALSSRAITGNAAREYLAGVLSELEPLDAAVLELVIGRNLQAGISKKTINKGVGFELIYDHPYMRRMSHTEKNIAKVRYPALAQVKMDGLYVDVVVQDDIVSYYSRSGNLLPIPKDYDKYFINYNTDECVYQGELLAVDESGNVMDRHSGNGAVNSDDLLRGGLVLKFVLWDYIPIKDFLNKKCTIPTSKRFSDLVNIFSAVRDSEVVEIVAHRTVESQTKLYEYFDEVLQNGGEGLIVKNADGIWKSGTSSSEVKMKETKVCELVVKSIKEGTNKFTGMVGSLSCESSDGKVVVGVGSGLSNQLRQQFFDDPSLILERIISVPFNSVIQDKRNFQYSLFLPRFGGVRTDKTEADDMGYILGL